MTDPVLRVCNHLRFIAFVLLLILVTLLGMYKARATDLDAQWANSPNAAWYKKQVPTPQTLKAYELSWESCCDLGDACQECVVHHYTNKPPWGDSWWYEKDGVLKQLPNHIVDFVPWTPTGKPVLFLAPYSAGKIKKGEPVCLKIPSGDT